MAWHGVAEQTVLQPASAGPRNWVSKRGGDSKSYGLIRLQRLRQHIIPHQAQDERPEYLIKEQAKRPASYCSLTRLAVPTVPAADADAAARACQLPVHGPVRRAARAWSTSHHSLTHPQPRCQPDLHASGATSLQLRQCAPARQTQSYACCNLIARAPLSSPFRPFAAPPPIQLCPAPSLHATLFRPCLIALTSPFPLCLTNIWTSCLTKAFLPLSPGLHLTFVDNIRLRTN